MGIKAKVTFTRIRHKTLHGTKAYILSSLLSPLHPLRGEKREAQDAGLTPPGSHSLPLGPSLDSRLLPGLGPTLGSDKREREKAQNQLARLYIKD